MKNNKIDKVVVQISAGRGPAECCWVVGQVLKIFLQEIKMKSYKYKIMSRVKGEASNTLKSVMLELEGEAIKSFVNFWKGTIQWVGQSPFRKFHKRKNWFIGFSVYEISIENDWNIQDLKYNYFKSSGPGGQHVNKTESAVRIIHESTGLSVVASDSRSQHQNKKIAMMRFNSLYKAHLLEKNQTESEEYWSTHLNLERGNPKRVFKGREFNEV